MRVAAAKPRRPRKKTPRQKRLEDSLEVQGSEVDMMELLEVEDMDELVVDTVLSGVMAILNPTACASYLFNHKRASIGIDGEMIE